MIYLDHAATTSVRDEVLDAMYSLEKEVFGNPSSIHALGRQAKAHLEAARRELAGSIGANEKEIIFTSGGTESNNLAIIGTALSNKHKGKHIITTTVEHQAVLQSMRYLETRGFHITYLPVNESGQINIADLQEAMSDDTILVSIMAVNNETGVMQPIEACADLLASHQAYFHTDAVQAYGTRHLNVRDMGIDLLTTSAHKINGPKGIGFLYVRENVLLDPTHYGGEQERKRRPGTENLVGIVGFAKAVEFTTEAETAQFADLKERFIARLRELDVDFTVNGTYDQTIATIVNLSFPGASLEVLLTNLDLEGIAASSGSACTAGTTQPSHVLEAMYGPGDERINNSVRFSFGLANTAQNVSEAADKIAKIMARLTKKGK